MTDKPLSILMVDDDIDICTNMVDILADLGYSVDVAHDGSEALKLARRRPYDIALLDLKLPDMDGVALCREIGRIRSGTVSLLITAYANCDTTREALEAGAWQVLAKPVDFPRLIGLIDEAAAQPLVLVVDDDPALCLNLQDLLHARGYRVCIAHDAREATERLRYTTRVILLDMRLPGSDGSTVFRHVREVNATIRIILITGYPKEMAPLTEQLRIEGADAVHFKPFDIPQLLADLAHLAGVAHSDRSLGRDPGDRG